MLSASPAVGGSIENWVMFEQIALQRVSSVFIAGPAQSIGPLWDNILSSQKTDTMKKSLLAFLIAAAPLCVFAQLPSYLPTDGLVGWWPFNGNANDESGNGNDGVAFNAFSTSDRFGQNNSAYQFVGNDNNTVSYISAGFNNLPAANSPRTISVWVTHDSFDVPGGFGTDSHPIIAYGLAAANSNNEIMFRIVSNNLRSITYAGFNNDLDISFNYDLQTWYNVVATFDGNNAKIYVNNSFLGNGPFPSWNTVLDSLLIGTQATKTRFHNGKIDDIAIYNRALTPEEITALYTGVPTDNDSGNTSTTSVPAAISYQAVARNAQDQPLNDAAVQVKFTLIADSLNGAAEYSESHSLTTNALGLFTTAFGVGTPLSGTFAGINWAAGNKYLKVELDAGNGFVDMGTQQLLSVPYAIQAKKSTLLENNALPVYSGNAAALAGGLVAGELYRTATGDLKIVY